MEVTRTSKFYLLINYLLKKKKHTHIILNYLNDFYKKLKYRFSTSFK